MTPIKPLSLADDHPCMIVTLGPSTIPPEILRKIEDAGVDFVRINLSHTPTAAIEPTLRHIQSTISTPIIVDTEGSQVRTGPLEQRVLEVRTGEDLFLYSRKVPTDRNTLWIRPAHVFAYLKEGDFLSVDFDTVILRVVDVSMLAERGCIRCSIITGGVIGHNKAVTVEAQSFTLPPLSAKDKAAIQIAERLGINLFTLSFIDRVEDVREFRKASSHGTAISKIETLQGTQHLDEIIDASEGVLIDRGDLSREVSLEKIPFAQKIIIRHCNQKKKPVFVATNFLDTMMKSLKPSRAEINDIVNTLLDGASGLVLAAETAIGDYPLETIHMLQAIYRLTHPIRQSMSLGNEPIESVIDKLGESNFLATPTLGSRLPPPHGGLLVDRSPRVWPAAAYLDILPTLEISTEDALCAEHISTGAFSPLEGFMGEDDVYSVLETMRLSGGLVCPFPVVLKVAAADRDRLAGEEVVLLIEQQTRRRVALLQVEGTFTLKEKRLEKHWHGATDGDPGSAHMLLSMGGHCLAGKIELLQPRQARGPHDLTPQQTRKIFETKGWGRVMAVYSSRALCSIHGVIPSKLLERNRCDGMFVHPHWVVHRDSGHRHAVLETYHEMLKAHVPPERAVFGPFNSPRPLAGVRQALFMALCAQNYGCSHLAIDEEHLLTNGTSAAEVRKAFEQFPELRITPVVCPSTLSKTPEYSHHSLGTAALEQKDAQSILEKLRRGESVAAEWCSASCTPECPETLTRAA